MADERTLLVVEDDHTNRLMLTMFLERSGFAVVGASSGREALALLAERTFDLVLLDVMMPGMSGLELLEEIRKTLPPNVLPVIMATALGESADIVRALSLGANDYVTKPIELKVLAARIQARLAIDKNDGGPARVEHDPAAPAPPVFPVVGDVLDGRYRLDEEIGHGGAGVVFRARHLGLESDVAVKVLRVPSTSDGAVLERFRHEGVAACRVRHPNAVSVIDFAIARSGIPYLAMELLKGHDLSREIDEHGALPLERCLLVLRPACAALAEAHQRGLIHRDVKPANLFLHQTPRGEVVKVLDFGIAKLAGIAAEIDSPTGDKILGTPLYMAPERLRNLPYDGSADVYSLGVVLFEMLTGTRPFESPERNPVAVAVMHISDPPPRVRARRPDVPLDIDELVDELLAKDPRARPSLDALVVRFAQAVAGG